MTLRRACWLIAAQPLRVGGLFVTAAGATCPDQYKGDEEGEEQGSPLLQETPEKGDPQLNGVQRPTSRTTGRAMN